MQTINQLTQIIDDSYSLKLITQAYSEISALKLRRIRSGIEKNRGFFEELIQVFRTVRWVATKQNLKLDKKPKGTISILLTSNEHFYGNLENKLIEYFIDNSQKFTTDRLVIGKTGHQGLLSLNFKHQYEPIIFSRDLPEFEEIQKIINMLPEYEQILVYYSRMRSVLVQEPHVVDILQRPPERIINNPAHHFDYIFEPELSQMLTFFNNQINAILFEQTLLESELARTASRMISMDQAQGNADQIIKAQRQSLSLAKKSLDSARLLNTIAALAALKKGG